MKTPIITLTDEQRQTLEAIIGSGKSEHRIHLRAQIVTDAADGLTVSSSSHRLGVTRPMVIKWRRRFAALGVDGLRDAQRSGQPAKYGMEFERRVLATLDETPPEGYSRWNGNLLARHLAPQRDSMKSAVSCLIFSAQVFGSHVLTRTPSKEQVKKP